MEKLEIEAFLKELGEDQGGMSKPVFVIASNQKKYLLKNQNVYDSRVSSWIEHDCAFLQEVLIDQIAKYLGISTPETAIINLEKVHIDHASTLQFTHHYKPGEHFGSSYLNEVENNLMLGYKQLMMMEKPYIKMSWTNFFNKIVNKQDIAKIIALDLLIANFDRFTNEGNLIIASDTGKRTIYAIDHGHAFYSPQWNTGKITNMHKINNSNFVMQHIIDFAGVNNRKLSGLGAIFQAIEKHVDLSDPNNHDFIEVVYNIESISESMMDNWFKEIPNEWFVDKTVQIAEYKKFILTNKYNIRSLIETLVLNGAFSNITGGKLQWRDLKVNIQ